jgi:predicted MFS family arabinose efflux permease
VNVPIGIATFLITSATMNIPVDKVKRSIDYLGIFLLVGAVTSLILVLSWAGEEYGWTSNTAILLFLLAALLTIGFLYWEPRANEPLVPPRLIKIPTLRIMIPLLMLFGVGMLGTNAFIPLFLQAVTGVTPTQSGLLLLPMIFGVLTAALIAGRVIERTGRYRKWLLSGSALMAVGMTILSLMSQTNAGLTAGLIGMFVMGFGTGSLGPVSTTVIQNSVEHPDLGITTSMITFFRSLGGAIGLATCGALFNVFARDKVEPQFLHDPRLVKELPEPQKTSVLNALSDSITGTFKWMIPAMILIFVLASMVKEVPLRQTIGPNTGTTD